MKIVFDARYVRTDFHDGISRYSVELGSALSKLVPVVFLVETADQLTFFPHRAGEIVGVQRESPAEIVTALRLNKHRPDVVFSPLQVIGSFGRKFALVLTLQDLIYHTHHTPPTNLRWWTRAIWFLYHLTYIPQRLTINRADVIATISESTKREIELNRLTRKDIVVVPNAPRDLPGNASEDGIFHESPPKNLLYMGSFMGYKNVETLVLGMEFLPGRVLHLLSSVSKHRREELTRLSPKGSKVIFHNGVSDEEYSRLLHDDSILVSASSAEGFGLPPIEALRSGVPVAVSDIDVFHEIVGEGGVYFDPTVPADFSRAIKALDPASERLRRVSIGKEHIRQFAWDKSAEQLLSAVVKADGIYRGRH
ncbi:MAG: glycosyltransferase family 4 protein [Rhodoglobus sp.]